MKVDLDEIGDCAVENAVGEITSGAAEEKSEAGGVCSADAAAGDEKPGDDRDDDERADDEDCAQSRRGQTGEKTEGNAGVARVNEIKIIANDGGGEVVNGAGFDPGLGGAVEKDDGEGEPEEAKARRKGHEGEEVKEVKEVEEKRAGNILGRRHIRGSIVFDFGEGFGAALADGGVAGVFANVR